MSAQGDLRDNLEEIHGMLPLTEREAVLAAMVVRGDGEVDVAEEIETDPSWWGEKALQVVNALREVGY